MTNSNVQACMDLLRGNRTQEEVVQSLLLRKDGEMEEVLWSAWSDIITAAVQVEGPQQAVLVSLVAEMKGHPVCSKARKARIWDMDYTEDQLPLFGASMREHLDITRKDPRTFSRFCSFSAQITQAGVQDLTLHGVWVIREALEDMPIREIVEIQDDSAMSGACAWFTYANESILESCKVGKTFEGRQARRGAAIADEGLSSDGLTLERCDLWKQRAEAMHKDASASQVLRSNTQKIIASLSSAS